MPKAYLAVLRDASLLPCSERDLYAKGSTFDGAVQPYAFMRVGRYSLVLGLRSVAVLRSYSDADTELAVNSRGPYAVAPRHKHESMRDRLSQLALARQELRRCAHPLAALVLYDADLELAALRRK